MHEFSLKEIQKKWHGTYSAYGFGFIISFVLTGISFLLVLIKIFSKEHLTYIIAIIAFIQAVCQLRFFLHIGQEEKPKWESLVFYFMVLVLLIIVLGSLWIMIDLNSRVMGDMSHEISIPVSHHD
jgi:cytochrome o ubiquinol oxidase operon protein cyoD